MNFERKKIGEILIEMGAITPAEVNLILNRMTVVGRRFGETGVAEGLFKGDTPGPGSGPAVPAGIPGSGHPLPRRRTDGLPASGLPIRFNFVPVRREGNALVIAIADPTDVTTLDNLELLLDTPLVLQVAARGRRSAV